MDTNSILNSVKKSLGLDPEYDPFDPDLIMLINTNFASFWQMGIGPKEGFVITGPDETWDDYGETSQMREALKTLTYLRVKRIFDPPASSVLSEAINNSIEELEFRLYIQHNLEKEGE